MLVCGMECGGDYFVVWGEERGCGWFLLGNRGCVCWLLAMDSLHSHFGIWWWLGFWFVVQSVGDAWRGRTLKFLLHPLLPVQTCRKAPILHLSSLNPHPVHRASRACVPCRLHVCFCCRLLHIRFDEPSEYPLPFNALALLSSPCSLMNSLTIQL